MAKVKSSTSLRNPLKARSAMGLNQTEYWARFGLTQSAGSRYESGRAIPTPVAVLVVLHEQGIITDEQIQNALKVVKASR